MPRRRRDGAECSEARVGHPPALKSEAWITQDPHATPAYGEPGGVSEEKPAPLRPKGAAPGYCLKTNLGPPTRFPLRSTITSTRSAIFTKGMPLFMP